MLRTQQYTQGSITLTLPRPEEPEVQPQEPSPPLSIKEQVQDLLGKIRESRGFPPDLQGKIEAWESIFSKYFDSLTTDKERQVAAQALCDLLFEVIRPAIRGPAGVEFAEVLLGFDKSVHALVQELLPSGASAQQFVAQFKRFFAEPEILQRKLAILREEFQRQMGELLAPASRINSDIQAWFALMKTRLLEVEQHRTAMSEAIRVQIENLHQALQEAENGIMEQEGRVQDISGRERASAIKSMQLIEMIRGAVKKV